MNPGVRIIFSLLGLRSREYHGLKKKKVARFPVNATSSKQGYTHHLSFQTLSSCAVESKGTETEVSYLDRRMFSLFEPALVLSIWLALVDLF